MLQKISLETQTINNSLIFDIFIEPKDKDNKSVFFTKILKRISEDFSWDTEHLIQKNLKDIIDNGKLSIEISYDDFIDAIVGVINREDYINELEFVIKKEIPQEIHIRKMQKEAVEATYPFFNQIFFIESKVYYLILCLGYSD